MKKLIRFIGAAVGLIALPALAQWPVDGVQTLSGVGFTCASGATTNLNWIIDCGKQANVGLQLQVAYDSAGTTNTATFTIQRSVDGSTYSTTGGTDVVLTANGTNAVVVVTNIPSQGARSMKVTKLVNSAGAAVASGSGAYAIKISAP